MHIPRLVATGAAALLVAGCTGAPDAPGPTAPATGPAAELSTSASRRVETSGQFGAFVDFSTLTLTPRGQNCLLEVEGQLVFTGTIEGTATGKTTALVFATCEEVATTPPGTHPDVFRSEATFTGTVDGEPVESDLLYAGRVQPGGHIAGRLVFSNGVSGVLEADSQVAVGGTYAGSVVVH